MGAGPDVGGVTDGRGRRAGRHDRAAGDPRTPARLAGRPGVDRQRLCPEPGRAADDRCRARRPVRPQAAVRCRHGPVCRRVGGVRARAEHRLADRGARGPGRRRGGDAGGRAGPAQRRLPARAAPEGAGDLRAVTGLGVVLGPLVGGAVVQGISWPWIFWVNVPIGLATIALTQARVGESLGPNSALDLPGLVLITGGAFGIVWALVRGNTAGWGSAEVIGALAAGTALLVAFIAWELRARQPMLPMRLFGSRAFAAGNAAIFL